MGFLNKKEEVKEVPEQPPTPPIEPIQLPTQQPIGDIGLGPVIKEALKYGIDVVSDPRISNFDMNISDVGEGKKDIVIKFTAKE